MGQGSPMNRNHERELIKKIQEKGCVLSYTELLTQLNLYRDIYHFVRRYLPNPSDAEEVTQETMFRSFNNIQSFDPYRGRFRPWVFGIAIHQAYDRLNERKHRSLTEVEHLPSQTRSPEEMLHLMEVEEFFLEAMQDLGERYRRILVLYYVDGLSHKEIAEREKITANNAGTILNRAKDRCLQLYQEKLRRKQSFLSPLTRKLTSSSTTAFAETFTSLNHRFLKYSTN